ncbi:MAG: response regulator, partial [Nitrospinota bacterium]
MEKNGKRHILLVDDENEVLSTVSFLLETEGFVVTTAENGKKALEVIERTEKKGQELVDLVISDLIMPEMDGLTLVESINNSKYPIPVLVITGHGEKETVIDLMRRG